jgi:predicted ATPase
MADLIQLRVEDFRAFRRASLELKRNGLMLVVGPNNAGKSALLSSFDVIAGYEMPQAMLHAAGQECSVSARWTLTDDERHTLLGNTSETPRLMNAGAARWLEWEFSNFQGRIQPVAISVSWPQKDRLEVARIDDLGGTSWVFSAANSPLATWDQQNRSIMTANGSVVDDTLLRFEPSVAYATVIITQWRQGYFHFRPLREALGRASTLTSITPYLQSTGANLATVLLYLHNNLPDKWERLVTLIHQIIPGVGQIMTPVSEDHCSIVFQDEQVATHQHNIKDLGTGVEQILMTLVVGLTSTATTVILEEPETGLHPSAQRALLGLLQDWSEDRLIVASTHSATMLDWTSPSATVLSVSRSGIESVAVAVTTNRASVLRELGVRLSDVLSAERILIVEGPTDKDIFEVWFPEVIRDPRVVVVPGYGGYNARHADLLAKWLGAADTLAERRILYIRDRDELSTTFLEKLETSPNIHVLPCRELENLLLDFEALAMVINAELVKAGKAEVTVERVASVVKCLADELKGIVVLKRTMADLTDPVRLVDNESRRALARSKANLEALSASVLSRVPEKAELNAVIAAKWLSHSNAIDAVWETDWQRIVPGADILTALWNRILGRGYSKESDGLAVAKKMTKRPHSLEIILTEFMADHESTHGG